MPGIGGVDNLEQVMRFVYRGVVDSSNSKPNSRGKHEARGSGFRV